MKKILSLCINLLLLIISDANPLQLIAGDRSVVKKDGVTHNISKYYVVPNDFDPNNVTNITEASQTTLRMNKSLYSKSMDANTASGDQVSKNVSEAANNQTNENNANVNNTEVNSRSGLYDAQVEVATQANDNIAESTESVSTGQSLDLDDLGNLQVEPITNSININSSDTINEIFVNNSSEALQNGASFIVENATQTFETDVEDEFDDLILTKYGIAVHESSVQNLASFWKLMKLNIDRISGYDKFLAKIERLSLLLNVFTYLYEAAQSQKPIESMIDSIIDILQIPFVKKSNTSETQSQTDVSGDNDEECLRICSLKRSKPQLDSNGTTYLSEIESLEENDNLELEKFGLLRRDIGDSDDVSVNTPNVPVSNQVKVSSQPTNILQSQLLVPNNLNVGVPDGYNIRSPIPTPTLNHVTLNNDIQEDPKSNLIIPDSPEIGENTDDQLLNFESILTDDWPRTIKHKSTQNIPWAIQTITTNGLPWHIEDKTTDNLPWHIEDKTTTNLPWHIEDKTTTNLPWHIEDKTTTNLPWHIEDKTTTNLPWHIEDKTTTNLPWHIEDKTTTNLPWHIEDKTTTNLPWHIEDKTTTNLPWHIEDKTTDNLPWHIEDKSIKHHPFTIQHRTTHTLPWFNEYKKGTKNVPWKVVNRVDPNWTIENKIGHLPITLYQSRHPSIITHGDKFLLHPNEPVTPTVYSVKHRVKKPYHIYTYVINPATSLYQIRNSDNIVKVKSRQPIDNLGKKLYGLSSHRGTKIVYTNKLSPSYYGSQYLFKPTIDISSQTSNSQLKHKNYVTYDTSNEANPSTLISETPQDDYQPKYLVGHVPETNHNPALLLPNTLPLDSQTNSDQENEEPQVLEVDSHPGVLLLNVPSNPFESQLNNGPGSTASVSASADTSDVNPDIGDTEPNPYNPNINLNLKQQTNSHPGLISKTSYHSKYTNLPDEYDEPSPVYGGETHKYPGLISSASSSSEYTNLPDEYDEPVYGEQTHQHPGLISSSTPSDSEYTNLSDDDNEPTPVYGGHTDNHPVLISTSSSSSEYTNLPDEYDKPVHEVQTHQHPGLISSSASSNSKYTNVADDLDEPNPVYGEVLHEDPGFISKASSHSEYTNLPNDYNKPTDDYEVNTDRYPVHIQTLVNGRPTENEDNLLVSNHPYGHTVKIIQPSLITHLHGNQPTGLNYLKHLKLKLAPTYRLFTLDSLQKLHDVVIKTIEVNGDEPDVYDNRALMNLRKIIDIILKFAKHLEEPEGNIRWYEKIFYNTQKNRHPLEIYVYNLIRQRWLHELMLVLYKNDFNYKIFQNPKMFSFLGSLQFPNYVLNFIGGEESIQHNFDAPEVFDQMFSTQHGLQDKFATHTYDDLLEKVPEDLQNYVTNNIINSYKTPNTGIVLSIAGVEAEPDANAIIHILQKYLNNKSFIEKQENVIIRDNKVEMLNQIILFLREKGYGATVITDLIRKLYYAVYSTEGKGCQAHHTNFAKNMYDVILPVLRRSGR